MSYNKTLLNICATPGQDILADQNVPDYQHINFTDIVFLLKERPISSWKVRGLHFVIDGVMLL